MGDGVSGGMTDDLNFSLENWFILMPSPRIESVRVTTNLKRKCWDMALKFKTWLEPPREKAMAPYSSTLAWKIPWTEEPGGLQSMGSLRVVHDWATSLSIFTFMHWRRKWQPTPELLPGESPGQKSILGCHLWGHRVGRLKWLSSSSRAT